MVCLVYCVDVADVVQGPGLSRPCHDEMKTHHNFCPKCGEANTSHRNEDVGWARGFTASRGPLASNDCYTLDQMIRWEGMLLDIPKDLTFDSKWPCLPHGQEIEIMLNANIVQVQDIPHAQLGIETSVSTNGLQWDVNNLKLRDGKTKDVNRGVLLC